MLVPTLVRTFAVPVPVPVVWAYVSDPSETAAASTHQKTVAPTGPLAVGTVWDEYHLDDDCDFDSVRWRCTALEPERSLTVEGLQTGARQRVTTRVRAVEGGSEVETTVRLVPSLRAPATVVERLLLPVVLLTPFGRRLLAEGLDESVEDARRALLARAEATEA